MRLSYKNWFKSANGRPEVLPSGAHPSWWHQANSDTVLVFVHGLLSDGTKCWTSSSGIYWPDLIKGDPETLSYSLFIAQYYTEIDSGDYDLVQCATALFDSLREKNQSGQRVLDFPQIVFVCHSLGGIITRRMLEENCHTFKDRKVGLVLLASPSVGSNYAYWARPLSAMYGNKIVAGLIPDDAILLDLDQRFRKLLDEGRIPNFIGTEACEHHAPGHYKWLPNWLSKVVPPTSASRYFGPTRIMEKTDHSTIAKPGSKNHPSYRFLKNFILDRFATRTVAEKDSNPAALNEDLRVVPKSALVLFDVYSSVCRPYYFERKVDGDITKNLEIGNVWLIGPSGAGKTAVVKRYADCHNIRHVEVSLGHHKSNLTSADLWAEISAALNPGKPQASLNELARELSQQGACLFLDEVPIEADRPLEIIGVIASLSEAIRRYSGGRSNILVCSIERPDLGKLGTKHLEHLHLMDVPSWDGPQLVSLCELIEKELPDLALEPHVRSDVIAAAGGAPRFLKSFFRRRLRAGKDETPPVSLALTIESFVHHGR